VSSKAVLGAGFGDEGKGLVTDWLCRSCAKPLVIRFCGGQQAGHTVAANGLRHVFSNFGAGTLRGVPTYFSRFCTIDPVGMINELNAV
jgi:adenylosuccinate synthase